MLIQLLLNHVQALRLGRVPLRLIKEEGDKGHEEGNNETRECFPEVKTGLENNLKSQPRPGMKQSTYL